jgi:uncharacterized protein (TIGR02246 family)
MATDEDAIRDLVGLHAQLTDDGDFERRVTLYTEDGELIMLGKSTVGREALGKQMASTADPLRLGKHITSNVVVTVNGDRADVSSDFAFVRAGAGGFGVMAAGRYADVMERHDGRWLFKRRDIQMISPPPAS